VGLSLKWSLTLYKSPKKNNECKIENSTAKRKNLAGAEGFEPPTIGFGDRCSTNWNYAPATNASHYTSLRLKVKRIRRWCFLGGICPDVGNNALSAYILQ
jgi:hypothetical protein